MNISEHYSLHAGLEKIQNKHELLGEIHNILIDPRLSFGINAPSEIKRKINEKFNQKGWADKVRVGNSKLTISFLKSNIGVCFQIGNVARTYADILKLNFLYKKGTIDAGVIIVPHKQESKMMGANYAQYDRLTKELSQFRDIIQAPILVIGLTNTSINN